MQDPFSESWKVPQRFFSRSSGVGKAYKNLFPGFREPESRSEIYFPCSESWKGVQKFISHFPTPGNPSRNLFLTFRDLENRSEINFPISKSWKLDSQRLFPISRTWKTIPYAYFRFRELKNEFRALLSGIEGHFYGSIALQ